MTREKGLAYRRSAKGGFRTSKQATLATGFMHYCMNSKYYFRKMCIIQMLDSGPSIGGQASQNDICMCFCGQGFVQRTISL